MQYSCATVYKRGSAHSDVGWRYPSLIVDVIVDYD